MKTQDLFTINRKSKRLNESLSKIFGKKLNLENFNLDQLHDARNKLRTQVSQIRSESGFNENLENDAFHEAQWMLDAINAEIAERDEHIIESDLEEGDDLTDRVEDFLVGWQDAAVDHEEYEVQGELVDLQKQFNSNGDIDELYNELRKRAAGDEFYKSLAIFFKKEFKHALGKSNENVEEGQSDVDHDLRMIANDGDEEELISALQGEMGSGVADVLNDMMSELQDELAAKGMNDVINDNDKMIEMLWDKLVDEYGGDDSDEGGETDDNYALASAGFGSDEDYGDFGRDESIQGDDMHRVTEGEIQQASAIVTAKTMVDRVSRWIEELSGMENDTLLQLGDSIRDEMGQEQAKAFIEAVAPAIQQALENLKTTRETLSTGVRTLTGEQQPAEMLGNEPAEGGEEDMAQPAPEAGAEAGAEMPAEEPAGDEFAAAEPAAGGAEAAGREKRESIDFQNRLLKVLAG